MLFFCLCHRGFGVASSAPACSASVSRWRMHSDDLNVFLLQVKTAPEDGGVASKAWTRGNKKPNLIPSPKDDEESHYSKGACKEVGSLDIQQLREELQKDHNKAAARLHTQHVTASLLTDQEAGRMAHQVLEYVLNDELGGRHNIIHGESVPRHPVSAELYAEQAKLRPCALACMHHVVQGAVCTVHVERMADGLIAYRKSLRVCELERDLVGGLTAGIAPHTRAHLLRLLQAGLCGDDAPQRMTDEPSVPSMVCQEPRVHLFTETYAGDAAEREATFSISNFLDPSSSDSD